MRDRTSSASVAVPYDYHYEDGLIVGAPLNWSHDTSVVPAILEYTRNSPNSPAILYRGRSYSYLHLACWALKIADTVSATADPVAPIAILASPGARSVAAALGIMMSGRPYLPLSASFSDQRICEVLRDGGVAAMIVDPDLVSRAEMLCDAPAVLQADEPDAHELAELMSRLSAILPCDLHAFAYLIYTSGTTGNPKGVPISHGSLAAMIAARRMVYPGVARFLMVSPLASDSSVAGVWGTLTSGGCLILPSVDQLADVAELARLCSSTAASHLLCVPSLYTAILEAAKRFTIPLFDNLRCVIVAGEQLYHDLVVRHEHFSSGACTLVNEYGPTEATVWASYQILKSDEPIAIGGPVPGVSLLVLDDANRPLGPGETGELCICGPGVADGYLNNVEATRQSFISLSVPKSANASRYYKTGDLVEILPNLRLRFIGRADQQVKVRGHRVDLLTLEAGARQIEGISDACAVFEPESGSLCLFAVPDNLRNEHEIRQDLRNRLGPIYVPAHVWLRPELPRAVSGKLDRAGMTRLAIQTLSTAAEETPVTQESGADVIAKAWAEVLNLDVIPRDINFMDLGGHSLMVFQLQDVIETLSGFRPSAIELFRHPTVNDQGNLLEQSCIATTNPTVPYRSRAGLHETLRNVGAQYRR